MKQLLPIAIYAVALCATVQAQTIFTGGAGDTPLTLSQFGVAPGPQILPVGGNPDGFLQVTQASNGLLNGVGFDRTNAGTFMVSTFAFDFRITAGALGRTGNSADGFSFNYLDTTLYGTTGAPPDVNEDPVRAGVLGFSFDTWSNNGGLEPTSFDDPAQPQNSNYEEISLFYNNTLVQRVNDTEQLFPAVTLDDGNFHRVTGTVNFGAGTVSMNVDSTVVFSNLAVPGLVPFESRISYGARTGGENEEVAIDNLNVQYVPEPTAAALLGVALVGLLGARRRRSNC